MPENRLAPRWLAAVHAVTALLGAFLLFQVQPLLSKWILPWFGGGTEVWTTCLLFFQSALFAGYAYAHLSERLLPRPAQLAVHLGLILAAAWLLPVGPGERWKPEGAEAPAGRILLMLTANVGVPYVLLASTGPLVQAWFSRTAGGTSPYRLFALSNAGSLAALVTYPVLVEPRWGLRAQSAFWMGAFLGFAALKAVGAVGAWRAAPAAAEAGAEEPVTRRRAAAWILLPAFASWMLLASTAQLCQDMAVIPFLWVLPLVVYLLSFIVAFGRPGWYRPRAVAPATAAAVFAAALLHLIQSGTTLPLVASAGVPLAALFLVCLLCHGETARLKPGPRFLTAYYLAISGGGALGGGFVSLVAPRVFSTYAEWKIGMALAYVGAWVFFARACRGRIRAHLNLAAALLVVAAVGLAFLFAFLGTRRARLDVARNFYGVVSVEDASGGGPRERQARDLFSGRILHGRQYLREELRRRPTTYYGEASGIGRALALFRDRPDLRVGVVGLGVGTLAAYGTLPTQSFRFYEINPEVIRQAQTFLTFLKDGRGRTEVVPGDARRSLEREPPQRFHVLALDAFSADTIPTHLLTLEAMKEYDRHVLPEGVLAVHVTNRYLDPAPVVRGAARRLGFRTVEIDFTPAEGEIGHPSRWILCARDETALRELGRHEAKGSGKPHEILWTDDHSDLWSILVPRPVTSSP
jgi:hypothetical protein